MLIISYGLSIMAVLVLAIEMQNRIVSMKKQDDNPDKHVDCLIRKMLAPDHDSTQEVATPNTNIHKHPREGDNARPYPYPREEEDDDTSLPSFIITSHTTPHEVSKMLATYSHDTTHLLDDSMSSTDDSTSSTPSVATSDHWPTVSSSYFDMRHCPPNNNNYRVDNVVVLKQAAASLGASSTDQSMLHKLLPEDYHSEDSDVCYWSASSCSSDEDTSSLSDFISPKLHLYNKSQPTKSILRASPSSIMSSSLSSSSATTLQQNKTVDFSQDDHKVYTIRKHTSRRNKSTLYYTNDELLQFKQEYRDEKKKMLRRRRRRRAILDGDEGEEDISLESCHCQDANANHDIKTNHALEEEEVSCDDKDAHTDEMDDMYKAQHQNLISVLNVIFAFKHQEDIKREEEEEEEEEVSCDDKDAHMDDMYQAQHQNLISVLNIIFAFKHQEDIKRLEEDKASAIQRCWRRIRSRQLAIKQEEEDKVTTLRKGRLTGAPKQEYQTTKWEVNKTKCSIDEDTSTVTDSASFITAVCTVDDKYDYDDEDSECIDRINNDMDIQYRLEWRRVGGVIKLLHHFKN